MQAVRKGLAVWLVLCASNGARPFGFALLVDFVMPREPYEGRKDAEEILEGILRRRNWTVDVRDELAAALERIVAQRRNPRRGK